MSRFPAIALLIVFLALLEVMTPEPVKRSSRRACQRGWEENRGRCFWFRTCRRICTINIANRICKSKKATLAKCRSRGQQNFFQKRLNSRDYIFLGASDSRSEGRWVWPDGSLLYMNRTRARNIRKGYSDWARGQPRGGRDNNCLTFSPMFGGKWRSTTCSGKFSAYVAGFVCERPRL